MCPRLKRIQIRVTVDRAGSGLGADPSEFPGRYALFSGIFIGHERTPPLPSSLSDISIRLNSHGSRFPEIFPHELVELWDLPALELLYERIKESKCVITVTIAVIPEKSPERIRTIVEGSCPKMLASGLLRIRVAEA